MSDDRQWSRRRFFSARGIGALSGGLISELVSKPKQPKVDETQLTRYWRFARDAMACEFAVYLPAEQSDSFIHAEAGLDEIDRMEDLLSVYRGSSAISYINATASENPVRIDDIVFQLLAQSKTLHDLTGGAFDVAVGRLIRAWGFFKGHPHVPTEAEIEEALAKSGMEKVSLKEEEHTVYFAAPGLEINLGSIGKGYAIDRATARMQEEHGITSALIQGGSSSVYALGTPIVDPRGWLIGIKNPYDEKRVLATVRLQDRALGTSGTAHQYFVEGGKRYGHVLDPRSGWPADELASVSVVAPDSATADALATALFVMGLDKARVFCQDNPSIGAVLVCKARAGNQPRIVALNLDENEVNLDPENNPQKSAIDLQT